MANISLKRAKFVQAVIEGKSNTQAAMIATGTKSVNSAKTLGHRLSTDANVQMAIAQKLEKYNITDDLLLTRLYEGLNATKTVVHGKDSEEAWVDEVPDHPIRMKALDTALKLKGAYYPNKGQQPITQQTQLAPELAEAVKRGDISEIQRIIFNDNSVIDGEVSK